MKNVILLLLGGIMLQATAKDIAFGHKWDSYKLDPMAFETEILDVKPEHVWSKMREVAESVRDHQLTAVPACHSVSKTYGGGRLAVWFKSVFNPSTVVTTAPSDHQVRNQLWREIRTAYRSAKVNLAGKMTTVNWDCVPTKAVLEGLPPDKRGKWEKNFMTGFSTTPDTASEHATKMHGWHNEWVLIIIDEAAGVHPLIWKAVLDALVIEENCKVLAIGNPTDPYCYFAEVCKPDSGWNVIPISVHDTPNYKACDLTIDEIIEKLDKGEQINEPQIIPHVAGKVYEARIIKKYGENSNEHKYRCLGEFPEFAEGVIWGPEISKVDRDNHIGDFPWDPTAPVYTCGDYGTIYTSVGFFQFIQDTIRMIDYFYDDIGIGIPAICKIFDSKPYNYAKFQGHWSGWDLHPQHGSNRKSMTSGRSTLSTFGRLGYTLHCCESHKFEEGIRNARSVFPLLRIDSRCMDFVDAIRQYKFKKNLRFSTDDKPAYAKDPEPTPSRHPADMFRYLSWIFRFQLSIDGHRVGSTVPIHANSEVDPYSHKVLEFGRFRNA